MRYLSVWFAGAVFLKHFICLRPADADPSDAPKLIASMDCFNLYAYDLTSDSLPARG
jgi:hypothetical protein